MTGKTNTSTTIDQVSLKRLFAGMVSILVLGFVLYGTVSWLTLERLRVNGPIYQDVVRGKDLIADILPPPAYIIEANLTAHELVTARSPESHPVLIDRLTRLESEFEARIVFWRKEPLGSEMSSLMQGALANAGREFFRQARESLVPALGAGDAAAAAKALQAMQRPYAEHREAVDAVVALATKANTGYEASAESALGRANVTLVAIFLVSVLAAVLSATWVARRVLRRLGGELAYAAAAVRQLSRGDLRTEIDTLHPGDSLLGNLRDMVGRFREVLRGIHDTNREVEQSIFQITTVAREITTVSVEQQQETESVATATEELRVVSDDVYRLATNARQNSETVEQLARAGIESVTNIQNDMGQVVDQVRDNTVAVEELVHTSAEINAIVSSIKDIASQTNLLALNAAIEAARAGEQGRGFAVVADEVRALSNRTADATTQIEQIVRGLNEKLEHTTGTMSAVAKTVSTAQVRTDANGRSIRAMADQAMESSRASRQIEEASVRQIETLSSVHRRLEDLFCRLRNNASTLGVTHNISHSLHGTVTSLQEMIEFFQVDVAQHLSEPLESKRQHPRLSRTLYVVAFRPRDGARVSTVARDFSLGGILIEAPCSLEAHPGDEVELEIKLPVEDLGGYEAHEPMHVRAKIVRCDERDLARAQYGLAFVGLNGRAKEKLSTAIAYYTASRPEQTKAAISRRLQEA